MNKCPGLKVYCTCFKGAFALVLAWVGPQQPGFHGTEPNGSADLNSPGRNGGEENVGLENIASGLQL